MAKQVLNMNQTQPLLQQVRGYAMAKRVNGGFFLIPQSLIAAFIAD